MKHTLKYYICPMCQGKVDETLDTYTSTKHNSQTGNVIVIPNVKVMVCVSNTCGHSYLPRDEERRIDEIVEQESQS
jgi:hypothetical protein